MLEFVIVPVPSIDKVFAPTSIASPLYVNVLLAAISNVALPLIVISPLIVSDPSISNVPVVNVMAFVELFNVPVPSKFNVFVAIANAAPEYANVAPLARSIITFEDVDKSPEIVQLLSISNPFPVAEFAVNAKSLSIVHADVT